MILTPENLIWLREKKCVLLDGAFDPLHAGHVRYFTEAIKAFPSYLKICAVASDDDIRAKGREPLFDQATRVQVVQAAMAGGYAIAKDQPTEHLINRLKPEAYIKGKDWLDKLPDEQLAACSLNGVQIVYLNTVTDSSSGALRRWALREAERGVSRLETFMAGQVPPSIPWRPVTDYSFEAREAAEGRHPDLIKEVFPGCSMLDAGCGPGHLVRMLKARGVDARGADKERYPQWGRDLRFMSIDISDPMLVDYGYEGIADVVICREVLEHLAVRHISQAVANLFLLAAGFVYITTRFTDKGILDAGTEFDTDPTHITCLSQPFLRSLCVLNGGKRRRDLETKLDHMNKGRVLVYEL